MTTNNIPYNYVHCFATKEQCGQCENCLRSTAAKCETEEQKPLMCVNPLYINKVAAGMACEYFREDRTVPMAFGFVQMLHNLSAQQSREASTRIQHLYGSRITYFRSRRGERPIPPEEQRQICAIMRSVGVEGEPKFDRYEDHYDW